MDKLQRIKDLLIYIPEKHLNEVIKIFKEMQSDMRETEDYSEYLGDKVKLLQSRVQELESEISVLRAINREGRN